jgi:hypothetical protein
VRHCSIHPQDPKISSFFSVSTGTNVVSEATLAAAIKDLTESNISSVVNYAPNVFDDLFAILCKDSSNDILSKKAFRGIVSIIYM